jgi:sugar lactone lactonase YvrE
MAFLGAAALAQQPRIDSVSPTQGAIAGGAIVSVRGANFNGATVALDGAAITPVSHSDSEVRLQMPPHDNGFAVISLRNASGSAYGEFLYVPPALADLPAGFITTVAGMGVFNRDYGPAKQANIGPWGLKLDRNGNLYIGGAGAGRVYRVRGDGTIERFAGGSVGPQTGDGGAAVDAYLVGPRDVAIDGADNVYLGSDTCRLRRVDRNGMITTIAGGDVCGFSGDGGPASQARIGQPTFLAADADDLFFIDWNAMRIRRIHFSDGSISTFAGNGTRGFSGDGNAATSASFDLANNDLGGLALDATRNVYLADDGNGRIRRIDRVTGIITTFYKPTPGTNDSVGGIRSLAFDRDGNLYYGGSGRIGKLSASGAFITSYGNGTYALPVDGAPAATSGLGHVVGMAIDAAGNILYSDDAINRVRRIDAATGLLDTIAGIGPAVIGENGSALATTINFLTDITFDHDGNLLVGETLRLRELDRNGNLLTIGGTGSFIGRFAPAPLNEVVIAPAGVEVTSDGGIDMADLSLIDHVDASGTLRWIAGRSGVCGFSGDNGPATAAELCQAWDIARDRAGNLFIADTNNNRIRRVDAQSGIITTVAGSGPVNGHEGYNHGTSCGDGGPAINACLNTPYGMAFDSAGNMFIAEGSKIRKVDAAGNISTFADGLHVTKLIVDANDLLYAGRFTSLERYDRNGVRTILAGTLDPGFSGDGGPALSAKVGIASQAAGIAIDRDGNLFFADGHRVRAVRYGAVLAPANASIQTAAASGSTIRATVRDGNGTPAPSVRVDFSAPAAGASCTLSSSFAITDANGVASVTCTPNCVAGTYSVTARPLTASASSSVTITNSAGPCRRRAVRH